MKILLLALTAAALSAQGLSPWTSNTAAPGWWLALHSQYLSIPTELVQATIPASIPAATASFSPQGAAELKIMVGRIIPGIAIYDVVVCSPSQFPLSVGSVYQTAVVHGISPLGPGQAKVLFQQTASRSKGSILLEIAADAAIALPVLGQSGLISMSSKYVVALLAGHVLFDNVQNQVRSHVPDPSSVVNLLMDPSGMVAFSNGACREGMMVARYIGKTQPRGTFTIQ